MATMTPTPPQSQAVRDKRITMLRDVVQSLKTDKPVWEVIIKAADRYAASVRLMHSSALALADAIDKLGDHATSGKGGATDLGAAIRQMSETFRSVENKREAIGKTIMDEIVWPLSNSLSSNKAWAVKFEKSYFKDHRQVVTDIKKAESERVKSMKRGQDAQRQAWSNSSDRIAEMEVLRQSRLREAIIEERRRYSYFLLHFSNALGYDVAMHDMAATTLKPRISEWTEMSMKPEQMPAHIDALLAPIQRNNYGTNVGIDDQVNGYVRDDSEYPDRGSVASMQSVLNLPPHLRSGQSGDGLPVGPGDQVRALYDYSDTDKLSFLENDVIVVMETDPSGWYLGNCNGRVGWFPSNYVEKISSGGGAAPPPPQAAASYQPAASSPYPAAAPNNGGAYPNYQQQQQQAPPPQQQQQQYSAPPAPRPPPQQQQQQYTPPPPPPPPQQQQYAPPPPPPQQQSYDQNYYQPPAANGMAEAASGGPPPPPPPQQQQTMARPPPQQAARPPPAQPPAQQKKPQQQPPAQANARPPAGANTMRPPPPPPAGGGGGGPPPPPPPPAGGNEYSAPPPPPGGGGGPPPPPPPPPADSGPSKPGMSLADELAAAKLKKLKKTQTNDRSAPPI